MMGRPIAYLLSTADIKMTQKSFNFARKFSLPLYFVSAADGTNVVKVTAACRGPGGQTPGGGGRGSEQEKGWLQGGEGGAALGMGLRQAGVPIGAHREADGPVDHVWSQGAGKKVH